MVFYRSVFTKFGNNKLLYHKSELVCVYCYLSLKVVTVITTIIFISSLWYSGKSLPVKIPRACQN